MFLRALYETESTMSDWSGEMECVVTNESGLTVAVIVQHFLLTETPDELPLSILANGASANFTIKVGSGANDIWYLFMIMPRAEVITNTRKQCNVEQEDLDSGKPVTISLGVTNFDILTPVSSTCLNVSYTGCGITDDAFLTAPL
jgi:hypothetical protein